MDGNDVSENLSSYLGCLISHSEVHQENVVLGNFKGNRINR